MKDAWLDLVDLLGITTWLGLLGLLAVPVVIIIYLIKSKYVPKTVSSTFIWQRSLKYMKRRVPLNFIMSFLLIMQILVVLAATLALLNPQPEPKDSSATIVIVDASSSMKAKNGTKSRYEIAIDKLTEVAKGVDKNAGLVVIYAGDKAELITTGIVPGTESDEKPEETPYVYTVEEALDAVKTLQGKECAEGNVSIEAALKLARDSYAIDKNENAKIYLYTDKEFIEPPQGLNIVRCNDIENDWNVGIVEVGDTLYASGYQFEITVSNQGGTGYMNDVAFLGYNRVNVTAKMIENKELVVKYTPKESTYYNPTGKFVIKLDDKIELCSINGVKMEEGKDYFKLDKGVEYELVIKTADLTVGEHALTIVERAEMSTDISIPEETRKQNYTLDQGNEADIEFAPATFFLNLIVDGKVHSQKVHINAGGKDEPFEKTFVFTSKTGNQNTDHKEYFTINSIQDYKKAQITIDTGNVDVISDDNVSYLGASPIAETKILYVSKNVTIKNGAPDVSKRTTLQIVLSAVGCQITSDNIYHSSAVNRAPTSGYTLYIYEGVVPKTIPTDGTVWFLNVPKESAEQLGIKITGEKDTIVENNSLGYEVSKSTLITGENKAETITNKVAFNTITQPGLSPIKPVVSRYGIVGTVQIIEKNDGLVIVETNADLPDGFESVYDATYYVSTNVGYKAIATPIMMIGELNGTTKTIITTFDFTDSSLPIYITDFPVLIKNMVSYSMPDTNTKRTYHIGDEDDEYLNFDKPNGAESIKYYYIPNIQMYDVYNNVLTAFQQARTLAESKKEQEAINTILQAISAAATQIDGFPETTIRLDFKKGDEWLTGDKLLKNIDFYITKYGSTLSDLKNGKTPTGQSIKKTMVGSWESSNQAIAGEENKLPTIKLNKFGTYEIVVTFKQEEILGDGTQTNQTTRAPQTYVVTTFLPDSECNITAKGEKLLTDISYLGKDVNGDVIEQEIQRNSILPWIVLGFIVLLIIEWGVYYRDEY